MNRFQLLVTVSFLIIPTFISATTDTEQAAKDVCKCLEEPYSEASKALELINNADESGELSKILSSQEELMKIINTSQKCLENLYIKYPEINKDTTLQAEVITITDETCPNPLNEMTFPDRKAIQ
ncbi:hypothetical protein [Photobacterium profundum]|uniref:Uncharacterized protein n=1 Tax=Photobacterium profundum 3TCK TaxID=314280 RepID=Q1YXT7_9GAMM|nr:hypothetical protein [Photobacterium profundum]EAS41054.1 hypothetical protein P3TCK_09948 [Photobacterium profundum 3TCK]